MEKASPQPPSTAGMHPAVSPLSFLLGGSGREKGKEAFRPSIHSPTGKSYTSGPSPGSRSSLIHRRRGGFAPGSLCTRRQGIGVPTHLIPPSDSSSLRALASSKFNYDSESKTVKLQSQLVGNASKVKGINRAFELVDGDLCYVVEMATTTSSCQPHLKAVLKKL